MMKKSVIVITVIILIFAVAFLSAYFILTFPKNDGEFSIDDFAEDIEMFAYQGDKKYEEPTDYKVAGKIGIKAINEEFGEYSKASIVDWMGCDVQYDKENEILKKIIFQKTRMIQALTVMLKKRKSSVISFRKFGN